MKKTIDKYDLSGKITKHNARRCYAESELYYAEHGFQQIESVYLLHRRGFYDQKNIDAFIRLGLRQNTCWREELDVTKFLFDGNVVIDSDGREMFKIGATQRQIQNPEGRLD